jgi:hypothetical protein
MEEDTLLRTQYPSGAQSLTIKTEEKIALDEELRLGNDVKVFTKDYSNKLISFLWSEASPVLTLESKYNDPYLTRQNLNRIVNPIKTTANSKLKF